VCIMGIFNRRPVGWFNFGHVGKVNFCYIKKINCLLGGLCVFHGGKCFS